MPRRRTLVPGILLDRQEYGLVRAASAGRDGPTRARPDRSVAWIPAGRSDDVRSPGPGGLKAAYGYQQSPSRVYLDAREHTRENRPSNAREWNARVSSSWKRAPRSLARQLENDMRAAGLVVSPVRPNDSSPQEEPRATTRMPKTRTRPRLRRRRAFFAKFRRAHDGEEDDEWALAESHDRRAHPRAVTSAEARRGPAPPALRGHPWVPASSPSYDRCQPEKHNPTMQFHAKEGYDRQTHHPPRDRFPSIVSGSERARHLEPSSNREDDHVSTPGGARGTIAPSEGWCACAAPDRDRSSPPPRDVETTTKTSNGNSKHSPSTETKTRTTRRERTKNSTMGPMMMGFVRPRPAMVSTAASPDSIPGKSRARVRFSKGGGRPGHVRIRSRDVLRATLGTEDWGEFRDARADGRGASSRGGAASSARFSVRAAPRRRRGGESGLVRGRAVESDASARAAQHAFPQRVGDKLGTKADRIRDEAHVAAVRKGLRGRAGGVDEYDDA